MTIRKGILALIAALVVTAVAGTPEAAAARRLNDRVLNRPYSDLRAWHLGFSIGLHMQDMRFTHNGYVADDGSAWVIEEPDYSPGFCVNGLVDLRLGTYFNLRFTPGMWFGNRQFTMLDTNSGAIAKQNLKSAYVVMPVDLKYSAMRYRNSRPYLTVGAMAGVDVAKKTSDYIKTKPLDIFFTAGFGCDFYLPYFKFIPEVKFCIGLNDILVHDRKDLDDEPQKYHITKSLKRATSKMIVFTFYFE